jgi:hypothetical protein
MEGPDAKRWSDGGENGLGLRIKRDRVADDGEGAVPVRRSPCAYVSFLFALAKSDPRCAANRSMSSAYPGARLYLSVYGSRGRDPWHLQGSSLHTSGTSCPQLAMPA